MVVISKKEQALAKKLASLKDKSGSLGRRLRDAEKKWDKRIRDLELEKAVECSPLRMEKNGIDLDMMRVRDELKGMVLKRASALFKDFCPVDSEDGGIAVCTVAPRLLSAWCRVGEGEPMPRSSKRIGDTSTYGAKFNSGRMYVTWHRRQKRLVGWCFIRSDVQFADIDGRKVDIAGFNARRDMGTKTPLERYHQYLAEHKWSE